MLCVVRLAKKGLIHAPIRWILAVLGVLLLKGKQSVFSDKIANSMN